MRTLTQYLLLSALLLTGCSHAIRREDYKPISHSQTDGCDIWIKPQAHFQPYDGKKVGRIELGDTGLSVSCSKDKAFMILRNEGCSLGANFIDLVQEMSPDIVSSCYRVKADFWFIDNPERSDIKANAFHLK